MSPEHRNQTDEDHQETNRCIYCEDRLSDATGGPNSRSEEHIIPDALGGRFPLVTRDCCRQCNNTLGNRIDAPLVADFFVSGERYSHKLKGKKGAPPKIILPYSDKNSFSGASIFEPSKATHMIKPAVTEKRQEDGTLFEEISGMESDVRKILEGKIRKVVAKAEKHLTDSEVAEHVSELMRRGSTVEIDGFHSEIQFDGLHIIKGLAKIGLGAGHFFFGKHWTFSVAASSIRRTMELGSFQDVSNADVTYFSPNLRSEYVGEDIWPRGAHLVAFQCTNGGAALFVSLFGNDILTAIFHTDWIPKSVQTAYPFGRALMLPIDRRISPMWHDALDFKQFRDALPKEILRAAKGLRPK